MAVAVKKYQIGGNVVVMVAVPVVNFELVFCHEAKSARHGVKSCSLIQGKASGVARFGKTARRYNIGN